jgi:hypothetical protein
VVGVVGVLFMIGMNSRAVMYSFNTTLWPFGVLTSFVVLFILEAY